MIPGEVIPKAGDIELNAGAAQVTIEVANTGDRPIQVGSHYHFFETNNALRFDRDKARGMRLDIAAGTAVRFEPGQTREVRLVPLGGQAARSTASSRRSWGSSSVGDSIDPARRSCSREDRSIMLRNLRTARTDDGETMFMIGILAGRILMDAKQPHWAQMKRQLVRGGIRSDAARPRRSRATISSRRRT